MRRKYLTFRVAALGGIIEIRYRKFLVWRFLDYGLDQKEADEMIENHKKNKQTRIYE